MTFNNYKEFCIKAKFYKDIYKIVDLVQNIYKQNEYRLCWRNYVYGLKINEVQKNMIWDYLNEDITIENLISFCLQK